MTTAIQEYDERQGKPSVSSFDKYNLCPGSFMLQKCAPKPPKREGTESGSSIHAALAGEIQPDELNEEDREAFENMDQARKTLVDAMLSLEWEVEEAMTIKEKRIWNEDNDWSGKPDLVLVFKRIDGGVKTFSALCIDYKRTKHTQQYSDEAGINKQLAGQAVLVTDYIEWKYAGKLDGGMTVALVYPDAAPSVASYDREDIEKLKESCNRLVSNLYSQAHVRRPGEKQCRWCSAKGICQEFQETINLLPQQVEKFNHPALRGDVLQKISIFEKFAKEAKDKAKELLTEDPNAVEGYELGPGRNTRKVSDIKMIYSRLAAIHEMNNEEFIALCNVPITKVEGYLKGKGYKGKALKEEMEMIGSGCIETTQGSPVLRRKKECIKSN